MKYIIRPCEKPGGGSLALTFRVDLPMTLHIGETFEHTVQEDPWPKEWDWLNGNYWRVDNVIYRKEDDGYITEVIVSPPLSK